MKLLADEGVDRQKKDLGGVVLLLRLAGLAPEKKALVVEAFLKEHGDEMLHAFSVISPGHLRIRKDL